MMKLLGAGLARRIVVLILTIGVMAGLPHAFAASSLAAQSSDVAGVRVVVTPTSVSGPVWEFTVVMDTHTKALNADLTKSAALVDETGVRHAPIAWSGDAAGGHHRKGTLRFKSLSPGVKIIILEIAGVGGEAMRTFRWNIK